MKKFKFIFILFYFLGINAAHAEKEFIIPFQSNVEFTWESIGIYDDISIINASSIARIIQIHVNSRSETGIIFLYGCGGHQVLSPGLTIRCTVYPYTPRSGLIAWISDGKNDKKANGTLLLEPRKLF